MSARIISNEGVETVSDREFFIGIFGHPPKTKAEKLAEWRADCERYADSIERGSDWAVPPPYLAAAREVVARRMIARAA